MPKVVPNPPPGFDDLTLEERIEYIKALWDRIAADPGRVPVPDWHREILRERLDRDSAEADRGRPWGEVRKDIEKKLGEGS